MTRLRIALVAHDVKKPELADWVAEHATFLSRHELVATGTTGRTLMDRVPGLTIERVKSGPLGGDQQIGARIVEGALDLLVFFWDPLTAQPHEPDVRALLRIAQVYDIPVACSRATASLIVRGLAGDP
ncbi:methylglyoxal synthase [Elioraea sp.]|uniref:methylglyoxal synthase n=1 Tax=Elioraea sp. TaxID=2185103 RepID=UPI003F6FA4B3